MSEKSELPFSAVLDALFDDEKLSVSLLYRLTDLTNDELKQFDSRWPSVDEDRRRVIVRHLSDISEDNYVVDFLPIFSRCFKDRSAEVRVAALDGIWDTTDTSLIGSITEMLHEDVNEAVRVAAASALAHYVLLVEWGQLPDSISPPLVTALLASYDRPETTMPVRRAVLEAMAAATHPRLSTIIQECYESDDLGLRLSAIFAMGGSADSRWVPILLDEMSSSRPEVRQEAAQAAGAIGDSDAVAELANLCIDEDREVALAAIAALGQIGSEEASEILTQMLDDPDLEELHEYIDEALEEMDWFGGGVDLKSFTGNLDLDED